MDNDDGNGAPSLVDISKNIADDLVDDDEMRKLIECPICLDIPLPPIYLCAKGHIVCNSCQRHTYSCPLCRELYSNVRSFIAEGIVEKCTLRCKNYDQGCQLRLKGSAMVDHLKGCEYRPVMCAECEGKLVNFKDYESHLMSTHQIPGVHAAEDTVLYNVSRRRPFPFEECYWPQYYFKVGEGEEKNTFLLRLQSTNVFVTAWVSYLGPQTECPKYNVTLQLRLGQHTGTKLTWEGSVNHFRDDPILKVYNNGLGITVPLDTIMCSGHPNGEMAEWMYYVKIQKVSGGQEEPVKAAAALSSNTCENDSIKMEEVGTECLKPLSEGGTGDSEPTCASKGKKSTKGGSGRRKKVDTSHLMTQTSPAPIDSIENMSSVTDATTGCLGVNQTEHNSASNLNNSTSNTNYNDSFPEPTRGPIQGVINAANESSNNRHNASTSTLNIGWSAARPLMFPLGGTAWSIQEIINTWDSDYSDMDD